MVPGSIPSIDLDTHGGEKNCSEQTGYPVSQGSAPGDQGALTIKYLSYILYISFPFRFHVCIYLRSGYENNCMYP